VKLLYFAWVRERVGRAEEVVDPPAGVATVADLMTWLAGRGEEYAFAFENPKFIRTAIDRTHVKASCVGRGRQGSCVLPANDGRLIQMPATIRLQSADFDAGAEAALLARGRTDIGAVVTFTGICRGDEAGAPVAAMVLEHYPGMAEAEIARHVAEAEARWPLIGATIIHRHGRLLPGDNIVLVVTAASHRGDAFAAAEFLMD